MSLIILDVGSGKTLNREPDCYRLVDEINKHDPREHEIILKAQLFTDIPPNEPLDRNVFVRMKAYAATYGYEMTASVFDKESLQFLLGCEPIPFVKIACRQDKYWLINEVPRRIPVYVSVRAEKEIWPRFSLYNCVTMCCVPEYPADIDDYPAQDGGEFSNHTVGWGLFKEYKPKVLEKHIVLKRDPENPDAGPFAILPEDLEGLR